MTNKYIRTSSYVLVCIGILAIGLGLFLIFVRPIFVFLPEDAKFIGATVSDVAIFNPALVHWIQFVFRSWGAFVFATGVLIVGIAANGYRRNELWAKWTLGLAGIPSLFTFAVVNYYFGSQFFLIIAAVGTIFTGVILLSFLHNEE